jgi:putative hemolysin
MNSAKITANKSRLSYTGQVNTPLKRCLVRAVEIASGCLHLEQLYRDHQRAPRADESFWAACIRHLQLDVQFEAAAIEKAPKSGPLVVIANHPYGVLDGVAISYLVEKFRLDFKILASAVLMQTAEVRPYLLPIDLSARPEANKSNVATRRKALAHLKDGGCLIIFPAGLISTSPDRWGRKWAIDPSWGTFTAHLIRRSQASVLPIFFPGQNGRIFQIVSHISRALRLALIFHEVKARIGSRLPIAIGEAIPYTELALVGNDKALIQDLRQRTYALATE